MKKILSILSAFVVAIYMLVGGVSAQVAPYTLFGTSAYIESEYDTDMAVQMFSDHESYGGIEFHLPEGTRFNDIYHLSTDFSALNGACGGGSPRFQIGLYDPVTASEKLIYAYIGHAPFFDCTGNGWQQSQNLLSKDTFIDAVQMGSLFYTPYEEARRYFGEYEVTSLALVVDSGWMFGTQSIVVDNIQINDQVMRFNSPDQPSLFSTNPTQ